jgi:cell division protein FtsL
MTQLANLFSLSPAYSILTVAVAGCIGFVLGLLLKSGVIAKHKKRVLSVENEMLSSHSRILELEKQVTDLKNEIAKLWNKDGGSSRLRVS